MQIINLKNIFNKYFFKKVTFILDNKVIKEGRLKLFSLKGFNLTFFILDNNNDIKTLEIPYPFELIKEKNGYIFDYRVNNLKLKNPTEQIYSLVNGENIKSRYFDKPLYLKIQ